MKRYLFILGLVAIMGTVQSQSLEDFELKVTDFGAKNIRKAKQKRLYVAEFEINYQLMGNFSETAQGGRQVGGSYRGDATASLVLGVPGIEVEPLQQNVDDMYNMFLERMKAEGYEIVTPEEAAKTKQYSDWERFEGGTPSESQNLGYIQCIPNGLSYFKKKIKKGRAKTGMFNDITMTKLGKSLNAVVAVVKLNIPVFAEAESAGSKMLSSAVGGLAKVVVKPDFRIATGIYFQTGSMSGEFVPSKVSFFYSNLARVDAFPKKDISITGVFDNDKKYKASQAASTTYSGTALGAMTLFSVDNRTMEKMQNVECEPEKYYAGVKLASEKFIGTSLDEFFASYKK